MLATLLLEVESYQQDAYPIVSKPVNRHRFVVVVVVVVVSL
jgi:hypothetical protein